MAGACQAPITTLDYTLNDYPYPLITLICQLFEFFMIFLRLYIQPVLDTSVSAIFQGFRIIRSTFQASDIGEVAKATEETNRFIVDVGEELVNLGKKITQEFENTNGKIDALTQEFENTNGKIDALEGKMDGMSLILAELLRRLPEQ